MSGDSALLNVCTARRDGHIHVHDATTATCESISTAVAATSNCLAPTVLKDFAVLERPIAESRNRHGDRRHRVACAKSDESTDRRSRASVSGGGSLRPGIVLDQQCGAPNRVPVAVYGKVFGNPWQMAVPIAVGGIS